MSRFHLPEHHPLNVEAEEARRPHFILECETDSEFFADFNGDGYQGCNLTRDLNAWERRPKRTRWRRAGDSPFPTLVHD